MNNTTLAVQHVSFEYDNHSAVLNDITFHAEAGESIGLVGANGVGKSTLLKLLVGLHLPTNGSIQLNDWAVEPKNLPQIREKIGYVFQDSDSQLFMSTAYEDIAFAPRNYGLPKKEVDARVNHALDAIGIQYLRDKQIYKMSGGEKKLVSIATILSMTPDVILMDEPSIALDPRNRRRLIQLLNSFSQIKIIASHDLDMILDTCERTILLSDGKIVCDGATKDILTNRQVLEEHGLELPLCLQKITK
mgnify:FL=1